MSWQSINTFFVKEHVGMFKASNNFDIYNAESGEHILKCREPNLGIFSKLLRFTDYKRMTPFDVHVTDMDDDMIVQIKRGISLMRSKVQVFDNDGSLIGTFQQKLLSIGGKFQVLDENDEPVCMLQGKWSGWDFKFTADDQELAHVTKKWSGIGKEMFTSADNYVLDISNSVPDGSKARKLIIAAVMCIDMVLKE